MAEKKKPSTDDAAAPRQKGLVPVIDWSALNVNTPVDWKLFGFTFSGTFVVLAALAFYVPGLLHNVTETKDRHAALTIAEAEKQEAEKHKDDKPLAPANPRDFSERQKQAVATNEKLLNDSLGPAPIEALEEKYRDGFIPRISDDGRKPWFIYSRPFDNNDPRPRIAIIISGLGLSRSLTDNAITSMPGPVTMIFSSTGPAADAWMLRARSNGHETILSVPMEPLDYPASDAGPGSILVKNSREENIERLKAAMALGKGYVGITTMSGSRITSAPDQLRPILEELSARGLLFIDSKLTPLSSAYALAKENSISAVEADFHLRNDMSAVELQSRLSEIETQAMRKKGLVIIAAPTPLIFHQLQQWIPTLSQKGFALAPITAMLQ